MTRTKLFLHRSVGEKIIVGEGATQVVIELTRLTSHNCTLQIEAPASTLIDRAERRLQKQGQR